MNLKHRKTPVYFIAELGQNHQGDINIAKKMIDSLKGLDVSCIKTAKRDLDVCMSEEQKNMIYDNPNSFGRTYYDHRKALELSKDDFIDLKNYSEDSGFDFISSFTDSNSLDFLCEIGVEVLKIASQRLKDIDLLEQAAQTKIPVIISTGMSGLDDVDRAVKIFENNEKYVLQCTSIYPCPLEKLNLKIIPMYKKRYGNQIDGVGFSGHHIGISSDLAAYFLGAEIIERHYTLERSWKGSDHAGALEKSGVQYILDYIEQIETSLGTNEKKLLKEEIPVMKKLRSDLL